MEPILFCGFPLGSSAGLLAAFEWLGQPYRIARVEMPADMLDDAYARLNPRRETPVLVREDGSVLTETMAIALWLATRDVERRISFAPGTVEADQLHQYMAFLNTGFTGAFSPLWAALEAPNADPVDREAWRRLGRNGVAARHAKLETMIGDTPYLLGDRPTLADGVFVGVARWADFHDAIDPARYPRLRALKARLEADPAVVFAFSREAGEPAIGSGACLGQVPLAEALSHARHR